MKYKATVQLVPPAPFGLPDGDSIVYPVNPDGTPVVIHFPTLDTVSKHFTNWGTLSRYRLEEDAIDIQHQLEGIDVHFKDNFVDFVFKAQDKDEARRVGYEFSLSLTHGLTYFLGTRFDFKLFKLEELEGEKKTLPNINRLKLKSTTYDLRTLHNHLSDILEMLPILDKTLRKSLLYFHHGISLNELSFESPGLPIDLKEFAMLKSESFLSLWKALTTIIGDKSKGNKVMKRCELLGITEEYYRSRIRPLRLMRNNKDIAHYDLEVASAEEIGRAIGELIQVTRDAISSYVAYRKSTGSSFDNSVT